MKSHILLAAGLIFAGLSTEAFGQTEELDIGKTSNGYPFEFQSNRDGRKRVYRVRSVPGTPWTPVEWKSADEQLLSGYIPRNTARDPGKWIDTVKTRGQPKQGKTDLNYGLNKDQFREVTTAFVWDKPEDARAAAEDDVLISGIDGTLASADQEREFTVNVSLVSTAPKEGELQYTLIAKGKNSHPLWLVNSPRSSEELPDAVCIVWESANSVFLRQHLEKPKPVVDAEEKKPLRISLKAEHKTIVKDGSAVLYFRGKEFARFSAPAYRSVIE